MQIIALQLAAHNLPEQLEFYAGVLGLPVLSIKPDKIEFQAGATRLAFHQADPSSNGSYLFAFNIPEHQFAQAVQWARQRVPLVPDETDNTRVSCLRNSFLQILPHPNVLGCGLLAVGRVMI